MFSFCVSGMQNYRGDSSAKPARIQSCPCSLVCLISKSYPRHLNHTYPSETFVTFRNATLYSGSGGAAPRLRQEKKSSRSAAFRRGARCLLVKQKQSLFSRQGKDSSAARRARGRHGWRRVGPSRCRAAAPGEWSWERRPSGRGQGGTGGEAAGRLSQPGASRVSRRAEPGRGAPWPSRSRPRPGPRPPGRSCRRGAAPCRSEWPSRRQPRRTRRTRRRSGAAERGAPAAARRTRGAAGVPGEPPGRAGLSGASGGAAADTPGTERARLMQRRGAGGRRWKASSTDSRRPAGSCPQHRWLRRAATHPPPTGLPGPGLPTARNARL